LKYIWMMERVVGKNVKPADTVIELDIS